MKKGMFTGWREVFSFTFEQNVKTKSFKAAIITISLVMFVIFFGINVGVGYYKDNKKDKKNTVEENKIDKLYILDESGIEGLKTEDFKEYDEALSDLQIVIADEDEFMEVFNGGQESGNTSMETSRDSEDSEQRIAGVRISRIEKDDMVSYELMVYQNAACDNDSADKTAEMFSEFFEVNKLLSAGIDEEDMNIVLSDNEVYSTDVEEADKSIGEMMLGIFLPMLSVLIMYMLALLHGQSISKIIVIEKNSKLMETLLISVKPYAVILGKVLAMYVVAIIEMAAWVLSGIAGYIVGDMTAKSLFDKYNNPVSSLIHLVRDNTAQAFSVQSVIICVIAILAGFLAYCVLSGLITSNITKAEDLANGSAVYQIVVVVAFLASYMIPLLQSENPIVKVLRYIPFTSAFMLPADVLIGNISIIGSVISVGIILASIIVMIIATGKIYKKKVF